MMTLNETMVLILMTHKTKKKINPKLIENKKKKIKKKKKRFASQRDQAFMLIYVNKI